MIFQNPGYLILLLSVPLIILVVVLQDVTKARMREAFASKNLFERIAFPEPRSRLITRAILASIALGLLIVALARPQGGEAVIEEEMMGIEIILAIDVSKSMLARDLIPNRLKAIKEVAQHFLESSFGDRIGVVAFAGEAIVVCPLTMDHGSVSMFIDRLGVNEPVRPGTAIGSAIRLAVSRFRDPNAGRVIILMTDGENNKGIDPIEAAKEAKQAGVKIYTVGVGTPQGISLPDSRNRPLLGSEKFRTDNYGNVIVGLDENLLKRIAAETGGKYFPALRQSEVRTLYSRISREGQIEFQARRVVRRNELAAYFLMVAALILIFEAFISYIPSEMSIRETSA